MKWISLLKLVVLTTLFIPFYQISEANEEIVSLTIYSLPLGQVYQQEYYFQDVAKFIDPSTVQFKSLTDQEAEVLEQNYECDLISQKKLLERYIDKEIFLENKEKEILERRKATLLSSDYEIIVKMDGEIHINPAGRIVLPGVHLMTIQ